MTTKPGDDQIAEEISRVVNSDQAWAFRMTWVKDEIAKTENVISRLKKSKDVAGQDYAERRLRALEKAEERLYAKPARGSR
jgi:hypothetical protein